LAKKVFTVFTLTFFLVLNFSSSTVTPSFLKQVLFFSLFALLFQVFRHIDLTKIIRLLTAIISPILFIYGVIQKYILFPVYLDSMGRGISAYSHAARARIESGRIFSIFPLPTLYTIICVVLLLAIFHYMLNARGKGLKLYWLVLLFLGIFNLILTQSFAGILYLLAGFPLYLTLSGKSSLKFLLPLLMTLSVFLFIITGLRFSEARKLDPVKLRVSNWHQALRMTATNPILGVGLGNYKHQIPGFIKPGEPSSIYAHNFILQLTAEGGIVILLLLIFLAFINRRKIIPFLHTGDPLFTSVFVITILYNLIDIGFYFFPVSLIFILAVSQLFRKQAPIPKPTFFTVVILIIPQLLIFVSEEQRRSGSFHMNFGRPGQAGIHFRNSLRIDPTNTRAMEGMAKIHLSRGEISKTDTYLARILAFNPVNPYAHYLRSRILFRDQKYITALYHAGKARSLNQRNREYLKWYEHLKSNFKANIRRSGARVKGG